MELNCCLNGQGCAFGPPKYCMTNDQRKVTPGGFETKLRDQSILSLTVTWKSIHAVNRYLAPYFGVLHCGSVEDGSHREVKVSLRWIIIVCWHLNRIRTYVLCTRPKKKSLIK